MVVLIKDLLFTKASPLMTISAIYSRKVTSTSVILNKLSFPLIGATHYMDLILRVALSGNSNNAILSTNGTF